MQMADAELPDEEATQAPRSDLPSFEVAADRLAKIVAELESGELSLERSLELFEEGVGVARAAQARLDAAERRVEELLGVTEDGQARTRELES